MTATSYSPSLGGKGGLSISDKIALGVGIPAILVAIPACIVAMLRFI
jgi:hypothetical protein